MSNGTAGRPQRCLDFQRQYDLKPARCQRITVSGRTIASASYILGNSRQTPPNISLSIEMKGGLLGRVRRSTLICCLKTRISASSATRDRSRSITIPKISLHKSNIEQQQLARFSINRQPDGVCDRDSHRDATMILVAYRHGLSEGLGSAPRRAWGRRASKLNSTVAPIPLRPPCEPPAPALSKSSSPRCIPTPRRRSFDWGFSSGPAQTPRPRTPGCRSPADCGV